MRYRSLSGAGKFLLAPTGAAEVIGSTPAWDYGCSFSWTDVQPIFPAPVF